MTKDKPFNVIHSECPEFYGWLKEISRFNKIESFVLPNYEHGIRVHFYTHDHVYSIVAKKHAVHKETKENGKVVSASNASTYLGCTVQVRKPRAGEDWTRGNDLADGKYCYETWQRIKDDIIAYELVKLNLKAAPKISISPNYKDKNREPSK